MIKYLANSHFKVLIESTLLMTIFYKNFTSNGAHTLCFVPLTSSRLDGAMTCPGVVS